MNDALFALLALIMSIGGVADNSVVPAVRVEVPVEVTTTTEAEPPLTVQQIIRNVWPDNLEQHALFIAHRESRYDCCVKTYCCYGVFQINWNVHHKWIREEFGLTSGYDLYDPDINIRVAYRLYQRAGGWGPWKCC